MAQGKDFYIPFQDGSGRIHGICWEPEETPWAVIQVAHGMIEHIGRYEEFAQAMNRAAFSMDTFAAFRDGQPGKAIANVVVNMVLCLCGTAFGFFLMLQ